MGINLIFWGVIYSILAFYENFWVCFILLLINHISNAYNYELLKQAREKLNEYN